MKTHSIHNFSFTRNMRIILFFVLFSVLTTSSFSQAYKNNWYFGNNIGLNFSSGLPVSVAGSQITGFNHSTTMSDDFGNLLFYSNSQTIWNANNNPIPLVGGFLQGSENSNQGVSFKNPANQNQYYYFYINPMTDVEGRFGELFYSVIDASGPLVTITTIEDVPLTCAGCNGDEFAEAITAVPHCNGIDYWLIVHGSFELVVYLVNANGVSQSGIFTSDAIDAISTLKSSPDGTMLALGTLGNSNLGTGRLILYDFNSTTGVISNEDVLSTEQHYGVSFSPNSQILYAINSDYLFTHPNQFGLEVYDLTNTLTNYVLPISSYSHAMQLANNGIIYINKNDGNLGAITTPDNFVNPNPTETTDGIVLSRQQAITQFIDAIQPPIPTNFMANVDVCGKVIVNINPCFAGYNVSWNFGDGIGTSTSASTSYVYTNSGTFTISLTVSLGVCSQTFTQQVTVNTCCTAPTTIPVAGANSSTYGSGFSASTIAINGDFTINNNFTINNKTLLMAPNTKIVVLPGAKLTVNKSELYSCGTDMWNGIEIRPGGELVMSKSLVEDAKVAVLSENLVTTSKFSIRGTVFNRNYVGIKVQQHQTGTQHPGKIESCVFDSRPSTTTTTNTRLLDAPYQNQTAATGLELSSVNSFVVGSVSSPAAKNKFHYLKKGIHALNSTYTVYNNEFSGNASGGWAIYNYKETTATIGGAGVNQPNVFNNLYNGIYHVSSSDLLVENNSFTTINLTNSFVNNATSVYTFECNYKKINLVNNQLNNITNGFVHFKNTEAIFTAKNNTIAKFTGKAIAGIENGKGEINVFDNEMNYNQNFIYSGNTAVYIAGTGNTFFTSTALKISNNTITKANKGIHVINIARPEIEKNTITFGANVLPTLSEFYFGIRTQNCQREEIHLNTVDKIGANPISGYENVLYGISVETTGNIPAISENTAKKMGSGFRFRNFVGGADFSCNTMQNNWYGLVIDNAKIGNQGEAPSTANPNGLAGDNFWTEPTLIGSNTAVKGYGISYAPAFYTRSVGYPFTPPNADVSPFSTISTFYSTPSIPLNQDAPHLCQTICYDPATCKIPKLAKIARNENPFNQVQGNQRFVMQEAVLRSVISDSLVIDTTTQDGRDLQIYIDTLALTNVGQLIEVTTLLSRGDTLLAESKNQNINPKECADAFHKTVNEIYFKTWAKNVFEFTPADSNSLTNIALQDPLVCGTAIYSARVMLNMDVNDYSVDNTNSNRLMNASKTEAATILPTIKGKWYPNPAKHEVNYEVVLTDEQTGQITIIDLMGKEHASAPLKSGNNKLTFDVRMLPNGLYFYRVMVNNKLQEVNKFIMQR